MRQQHFEFVDTLPARSNSAAALDPEQDVVAGRLPVNCNEIRQIIATCILEVIRREAESDRRPSSDAVNLASAEPSTSKGGQS